MRGVRSIDMMIHPPPDLAIEVENTHKATASMPIYAQLGVPEVWRFEARQTTLGFWRLDQDGTYALAPTSFHFPFLDTQDVLLQLHLAEELQSYTDWFGHLTDWVRDVILPRLDPA